MAEMIIYKKSVPYKVLFDDDDLELVNKYRWRIVLGYVCGYLIGNYKKTARMHRLILGLGSIKENNIEVDHINHIRTDNRKCNLRKATKSQNNMNILPKGNSKYLGVSVNYQKTKYKDKIYIHKRIRAYINIDGKNVYLGTFKTEEEGALDYDKFAKIHHKEFANLNFKNNL